MIDTIIVSFADDNKSIVVRIRTKVFVEEQNIDAGIDFDGLDDVATHVLVGFQEQFVGTARILTDGHIGRVAVLPDYRQKGIGYAAVQALLSEARSCGLSRVYLSSQIQASDFYKKMGFQVCGEIFMEAGIEHIKMELFL